MTIPEPIITVEFSQSNGDYLLNGAALVLLLGVPKDVGRRLRDWGDVPDDWYKQGRRRAREAEAHGAEGIFGIMRYWARKDHSATVEFIVDGRRRIDL